MTPRSNQPIEPNPDQGMLVSAIFEKPDPHAIGNAVLEIHPDGVFLDKVEIEAPENAVTAEKVAAAGIAEATKTANRRKAQEGKHSPLIRDGNYEHIIPGDYLPGFGPVKDRDRDWDRAVAHARKLEYERRKNVYEHPTLDEVTTDDMRRVVTGDLNEPVHVGKRTDTLPRLTKIQDRLNAAVAGAETAVHARVVPMTKQETTTMLAINDHISRAAASGKPLRGTTHSYVMESHDNTVNLVKNVKKYPKPVAEWYADRTFASRAYELVDYFEDSAKSVGWLEDFAAKMSDALNPMQKKAIIEGEYHPAMGVLAGYLTVAKLESGRLTEEDVSFAPLTHQVNREVRMMELPTPTSKYGAKMSPEALEARKKQIEHEVKSLSGMHTDEARYERNKTYVMPFTNPDMEDDVQQFIQGTIASIPVGQLDSLIKTVRTASVARQEYWRERLEDISGKYKKLVAPTLEKYSRSAKLQ